MGISGPHNDNFLDLCVSHLVLCFGSNALIITFPRNRGGFITIPWDGYVFVAVCLCICQSVNEQNSNQRDTPIFVVFTKWLLIALPWKLITLGQK